VTRAPIAAWRRLLAAGGGPAASHAVLARAPAPERLLEPLAHVALVGATSLEALTRPLDVSAVLARVLDGASGAETTSLDADGARRGRGVIPPPGPARPARGEPDAQSAPRARPASQGADPATPLRADRLPASQGMTPRPSRPPAPSLPRAVAAGELAGPSPESVAERAVAVRRPLPVPAVADAHRGRWRPALGPEARIGAATRVVFGVTDEDLERALVRGGPATPAASPAAKAANPDRSTPGDAEPDAARLLGRAVERVSERARDAPPAGRPARETAAPVTGTAPSPGGFRGLALRALGPSDEARHVPVPLEREPRPAPESRLDDLDTRVAESLARILEREARRHGIDVTGARA
jgi:hypothetical protein